MRLGLIILASSLLAISLSSQLFDIERRLQRQLAIRFEVAHDHLKYNDDDGVKGELSREILWMEDKIVPWNISSKVTGKFLREAFHYDQEHVTFNYRNKVLVLRESLDEADMVRGKDPGQYSWHHCAIPTVVHFNGQLFLFVGGLFSFKEMLLSLALDEASGTYQIVNHYPEETVDLPCITLQEEFLSVSGPEFTISQEGLGFLSETEGHLVVKVKLALFRNLGPVNDSFSPFTYIFLPEEGDELRRILWSSSVVTFLVTKGIRLFRILQLIAYHFGEDIWSLITDFKAYPLLDAIIDFKPASSSGNIGEQETSIVKKLYDYISSIMEAFEIELNMIDLLKNLIQNNPKLDKRVVFIEGHQIADITRSSFDETVYDKIIVIDGTESLLTDASLALSIDNGRIALFELFAVVETPTGLLSLIEASSETIEIIHFGAQASKRVFNFSKVPRGRLTYSGLNDPQNRSVRLSMKGLLFFRYRPPRENIIKLAIHNDNSHHEQ